MQWTVAASIRLWKKRGLERCVSPSPLDVSWAGSKLDAGLAHLLRLTALEELELSDTPTSDEGRAQLQQALPHCMIW